MWADLLIAQSEMPPPWMLDLSLVDQSNTLAVCAALKAVPGEADTNESIALINGLVFRQWKDGQLTIGQVRGIGWELYRSEFERRDLSQWGVVIECEGESLDDGYLSETQMREVIYRELAPFQLNVARLPAWAY